MLLYNFIIILMIKTFSYEIQVSQVCDVIMDIQSTLINHCNWTWLLPRWTTINYFMDSERGGEWRHILCPITVRTQLLDIRSRFIAYVQAVAHPIHDHSPLRLSFVSTNMDGHTLHIFILYPWICSQTSDYLPVSVWFHVISSEYDHHLMHLNMWTYQLFIPSLTTVFTSCLLVACKILVIFQHIMEMYWNFLTTLCMCIS